MRIQSGLTFTFGQFSLADICSIFAFFDEFGSVGLWRASGESGGNLTKSGELWGRLWGGFGEASGGGFREALGRLWEAWGGLGAAFWGRLSRNQEHI